MSNVKGAKPSREQRRDAARAQAAKLREEQAARERRTRNILFAVLGGIVVIAIIIGVVIWRIGSAAQTRSLLEDFEGAVPANSDIRGGVTVGATGTAGEDVEGLPNLTVYVDFMCSWCGVFEETNAADLDELREAGELAVTYHLVGNLDSRSNGTEFSSRSANAAVTIAGHSPEHFVAFVEGVFEQQPEMGTPGLSDEELAQIALDAGVSQDVVDLLDDGLYRDWLAVATQQAQRDDARGTPTVFLDGEKVESVDYYSPGVLKAWLQEQAAGGE